jgi:acetyltransferase-like isoleucine patch superfamily enzyme
MKEAVKAFLWRRFDPIVARIGSRLWHLGAMRRPIDRRALDRLLILAPSTGLGAEADLFNHAAREHFSIGEYGTIHGIVGVSSSRGRLAIGHHVLIGPQTRINANLDIRIGHYVFISHAVDIYDNDSHSLDPFLRRQESIAWGERGIAPDVTNFAAAPVRIEDQAWICFKATILKGVTIGQGAIVAAGAVVTDDVAPFTMVAGNPARFVKRVDGDIRRAIEASDEGWPQRRSL